ncbi:MAG: hypothetical protein ACUVRM_09750, partial [Bacillota bacterium]
KRPKITPDGFGGAEVGLEEHELVRVLVMQLTGRRLSPAGREFLARTLAEAAARLKQMEEERD